LNPDALLRTPKDLEDLISRSGYLGPLIYIGAYAAAAVLLFPASLLTLGAGYLFGGCPKGAGRAPPVAACRHAAVRSRCNASKPVARSHV
jgi:hypothetical protein